MLRSERLMRDATVFCPGIKVGWQIPLRYLGTAHYLSVGGGGGGGGGWGGPPSKQNLNSMTPPPPGNNMKYQSLK